MRLMSFALTTDQVRRREKTVTRRRAWLTIRVGEELRGVVKSMGRRKGEPIEDIAVIRIVSVRRERLDEIDQADVIAEGFPGMSSAEFVAMFCEHMAAEPSDIVTRIEFEYVDTKEEAA